MAESPRRGGLIQPEYLPGFVFALITYVVAVKTLLYLIGFLSNRFVSRGIDQGPETATTAALWINAALLLSFFVVHSLMARQAFKDRLHRVVDPIVERSLYIVVACLQLWLIFTAWRAMPHKVWHLEAPWATAVWGVAIAAWLTSLLAIRNLDHVQLFGLRHPWQRLRGQPLRKDDLIENRIHGVVRHPMYLGFLVGVWATPEMSQGHLLFAGSCAIYILIGIAMEERKLLRQYGERYANYRQRVGGLIPWWPRPR